MPHPWAERRAKARRGGCYRDPNVRPTGWWNAGGSISGRSTKAWPITGDPAPSPGWVVARQTGGRYRQSQPPAAIKIRRPYPGQPAKAEAMAGVAAGIARMIINRPPSARLDIAFDHADRHQDRPDLGQDLQTPAFRARSRLLCQSAHRQPTFALRHPYCANEQNGGSIRSPQARHAVSEGSDQNTGLRHPQPPAALHQQHLPQAPEHAARGA